MRRNWSAVHPHGRGEHARARPETTSPPGSSPRAWGTRRREASDEPLVRFIPTGVGNTDRSAASGRSRPVHPHGRGEHIVGALMTGLTSGSSPRAWGTLFNELGKVARPRFIPTGVGNTMRPRSLSRSNSVHPHGRGEHDIKQLLHGLVVGSSPRAWGTPATNRRCGTMARFIPTGVGNTRWLRSPTTVGTVHPHGRGEHRDPSYPCCGAIGSSPRAWGTRPETDA